MKQPIQCRTEINQSPSSVSGTADKKEIMESSSEMTEIAIRVEFLREHRLGQSGVRSRADRTAGLNPHKAVKALGQSSAPSPAQNPESARFQRLRTCAKVSECE